MYGESPPLPIECSPKCYERQLRAHWSALNWSDSIWFNPIQSASIRSDPIQSDPIPLISILDGLVLSRFVSSSFSRLRLFMLNHVAHLWLSLMICGPIDCCLLPLLFACSRNNYANSGAQQQWSWFYFSPFGQSLYSDRENYLANVQCIMCLPLVVILLCVCVCDVQRVYKEQYFHIHTYMIWCRVCAIDRPVDLQLICRLIRQLIRQWVDGQPEMEAAESAWRTAPQSPISAAHLDWVAHLHRMRQWGPLTWKNKTQTIKLLLSLFGLLWLAPNHRAWPDWLSIKFHSWWAIKLCVCVCVVCPCEATHANW